MSEHRATVTIEWDGNGEAGRTVIEVELDKLMEQLLALHELVQDPDISANLNARRTFDNRLIVSTSPENKT